jgi:hypothetical protein
LSLLALALALGGCVVGGGGSHPPPGFSTAYEPDVADGAAAPLLHAVDGTGAGNAWAVGEGGATLRQASSSKFQLIASTAPATLGGLWALDVNHALAVERGGANVFLWSGGAWAALGAPRADRAAAATWGSATNNLWVAGDGVEHWDGTAWTQVVPSGAMFTAMSGSFDTDVWAVGPGGARHWDGHVWSPVPLPAGTPALAAVWTSGLFDTWIVGAQGTVLHWNGSTLSRLPVPTTKDLTSISGTGQGDVWVGGQDGELLHWDGTVWIEHVSPAARTIEDVWTALGADVLFVDGTSALSRYVY